MMKNLTRALSALIVLAFLTHLAFAQQFPEQRVWGGTSGGSANAYTLTIAGWPTSTPLTGVPVRFIPVANSTTASTLAIGTSGTYNILKASTGGPTALTGGELQTTQPVEVVFNGAAYILTSSSASTVTTGAANLGNSALAYTVPTNLQINATVASNQLTISVVGNNGSNASSTNPTLTAFRDTTIASGDPVIVSLQTALSFTINSGNTMGCVSGQMCRLWVWLINNGGTVALCAYNTLSGVNIVDLNEAATQTSASGASGGNSAQTLYCSTSAVSAKSVRRIGYIDIQESTAGTWATGPTYIQLFGPGIHRPGEVVQGPFVTSTTSASTTTSATYANIGPTQAITLFSPADVVEVVSDGSWLITTAATPFIQLVHVISASTTLIGNPYSFNQGSGTSLGGAVSFRTLDVPNTSSSVTYGTQGKTGAGTLSYPPASSGAQIIVKELMVMRKPANDNELLRMVG